MSKGIDDQLKHLYSYQIKRNSSLAHFSGISGIIIFCICCAIIIILHSMVFFHLDFEDWNIQKCNPKYVFYSGYIKQNPDSDSATSTIDNFNDCVIHYSNQANRGHLLKNESSKKKMMREVSNNYNNISSSKALELQRRINDKNKEYEIVKSKLSNNSNLQNLKSEIAKLNILIDELKQYAHSYLSYAMMHFVFKYKIAEKNDEIDASYDKCGDHGNETYCQKDDYCLYDTNNDKCVNKGDFFKDKATEMNELMKKYFDGNKL